jgi:hypothetical protein
MGGVVIGSLGMVVTGVVVLVVGGGAVVTVVVTVVVCVGAGSGSCMS